MNHNKLNIVLHSDEAFAMQACTMILSVCENNKAFEAITFYILDTGISEDSRRQIADMVFQYQRKLVFIDTQEMISSLESLGIQPYQGINMGVYLKGMLSKLLPGDLERILYIDCDAVVNGSLRELWETNSNGMAIGMAVDCMNKRINEGYGFQNRYYYNTGVMLIDFSEWLHRNCEEKYIKYILDNAARKFEWADQDLINASLNEDTFKLSPRYNWLSLYEIYNYESLGKIYGLNEQNYYTKEEFEAAHDQPVIYHFPSVFIGRPWFQKELLKKQDVYDKYLYSKYNPWKNHAKTVKKYPAYTKVQRLLYRGLPQPLFVRLHQFASRIFSAKITHKSHAPL